MEKETLEKAKKLEEDINDLKKTLRVFQGKELVLLDNIFLSYVDLNRKQTVMLITLDEEMKNALEPIINNKIKKLENEFKEL